MIISLLPCGSKSGLDRIALRSVLIILIITEISSLATNLLTKGLAVFDTRERLVSVHHSPPQSRLSPIYSSGARRPNGESCHCSRCAIVGRCLQAVQSKLAVGDRDVSKHLIFRGAVPAAAEQSLSSRIDLMQTSGFLVCLMFRRGEQPSDLFRAQYNGQAARLSGRDDLLGQIVSPQRDPEEEP